jgi:hypothetical protein
MAPKGECGCLYSSQHGVLQHYWVRGGSGCRNRGAAQKVRMRTAHSHEAACIVGGAAPNRRLRDVLAGLLKAGQGRERDGPAHVQ